LRARKPTLRGDAAEPVRQLAVMLASVSRPPVPICIPARPALSNFGDLWFLGRHRVLCGNALERSDFETLIGGERAAVTFTDPPDRARRRHQLDR
jgi:hypothetical protein